MYGKRAVHGNKESLGTAAFRACNMGLGGGLGAGGEHKTAEWGQLAVHCVDICF